MPHTCSKTYQHCVPIQIVPLIQTAANTLSPKTREHLRHEIQSPRTGNILDLFRVIHLYWLSSSIHDWLHMGISNSEINLSGIFSAHTPRKYTLRVVSRCVLTSLYRRMMKHHGHYPRHLCYSWSGFDWRTLLSVLSMLHGHMLRLLDEMQFKRLAS